MHLLGLNKNESDQVYNTTSTITVISNKKIVSRPTEGTNGGGRY